MDIASVLHILSTDTLIVWAYVAVFVAVFLESIPVVGVVIPGGTPAVLAAGIFARLGYFSVSAALLVPFFAALLVDNLSYFVGKGSKRRSFHRFARALFVPQLAIDRVCSLIHGHTGKAIILGRLNPPTRAIAPFMVGMERVRYRKFLFFSVVSAALWVAIFFVVGFLFGKSLENIDALNRGIIWVVILAIVTVYVLYVVRSYYGKKAVERRNC